MYRLRLCVWILVGFAVVVVVTREILIFPVCCLNYNIININNNK